MKKGSTNGIRLVVDRKPSRVAAVGRHAGGLPGPAWAQAIALVRQGVCAVGRLRGALAVVGLATAGAGAAFSSISIAATVACTAAAVWALLWRPWLGTAAVVIALGPWWFYAALTIIVVALHLKYMVSVGSPLALGMLTAAYTFGAGWLLVRGLRRGAGQEAVRATAWPRGRLAVALSVAAALHLMTFWNLDLAAQQQLATLRAEAGALALSVAPPRLPDRDNAALVYQQAFEVMGWRGEWDKQWQDAWDNKWTAFQESGKLDFDPNDPELRRFLKTQAGTLSLFRQAAAKPGCSFKRDYGRPDISMLLPELQPLRTAAHLLALEALVRASDKDYRGSIDDINAMLHMAEHVGADPLLVSEIVAIYIERLGNQHVPAHSGVRPASA